MNKINFEETDKLRIVAKIQDFLNINIAINYNESVNEIIKRICVARLCKAIGLTGNYNYKSDFFEFFSSVVGEAVCEILSIKLHIANGDLRFVKYEHINLVEEVKTYFETQSIEEAFLNAFELLDRFKYLIVKLKKSE